MSQTARRKNAFLRQAGVSAVLLKTSERLPDSNVSYFTGLNRQFLSGHALVLRASGQPLLLKSILEPKAKVAGVRIRRIDKRKQFESVLREELKGIRKLGINRPLYTSAGLGRLRKIVRKVKLVDVSRHLAVMRATKTDDEIANIRTACRIAERVAGEIPSLFRKDMSEKELALKVELLLRERGENILPFPVIVASGHNAAFPHHVPGNKKIGKGLLLLDFGAFHRNYCSDITRVFSVGKPSGRQEQLYASVFAAKQSAQDLCRPGSSFGGIFEKADNFLKKGTGFSLVHGLGHGLGVEPHDFPSGFLEGSREKLRENMVLTIEPGIYGGFGGIRIEDDVLVTQKGCKPLTRAPAELLQL